MSLENHPYPLFSDNALSGGACPSLPPAEPAPEPSTDSWTLFLLCLGLLITAACVLLPQVDSNRRLAYERDHLQTDLDQLQTQVATNQEFLKRLDTDPELTERLAMRQMKLIPQGRKILDLGDSTADQSATAQAVRASPFYIANIAPPPPAPPYQPLGGAMADAWLQPQRRLYLMGAALFLVAAGLILGGGPSAVPRDDAAEPVN